jgi:hypothetical protein
VVPNCSKRSTWKVQIIQLIAFQVVLFSFPSSAGPEGKHDPEFSLAQIPDWPHVLSQELTLIIILLNSSPLKAEL